MLPEMWQSIFFHDELRLLPVIYVDDFTLVGDARRPTRSGTAG